MKIYLVKSYNNSERHSIDHMHGFFNDLKFAQEAIPRVWYAIFKDDWGNRTEPTIKTENKWIQKWGRSIEDGGDGHFMSGYTVAILEIELNKLYIDLDPEIYNPNEEKLKEIK